MPHFEYERATLVLAEAEYFGKKLACQKYQVPPTTYNGWKQRLKKDKKLREMVAAQSQVLSQQWQGETIKTLNLALSQMQQTMRKAPTELDFKSERGAEMWVKTISSLAGAIKNLGELALATHVLMEDESDEDGGSANALNFKNETPNSV